MTLELRLGGVALALFALFVAVGLRVARRPLGPLDARAVCFRGQLTPLALVFTMSGRSRALTSACIVAIAMYAALRLPIAIPIAISASQLFSQLTVEFSKTLFKRIRPDYWLVGLDAGHSYPSGHAVTAIVFFMGWALVVALGTLPAPVKTVFVTVFALWALAIVWSRLALGAHYLSDVFGGALFGAAWLCMAFTLSTRVYDVLR